MSKVQLWLLQVFPIPTLHAYNISGKHRRLVFNECPNDVNAMIDAAKTADLVLLLVDASFGFEMVCCSRVMYTFADWARKHSSFWIFSNHMDSRASWESWRIWMPLRRTNGTYRVLSLTQPLTIRLRKTKKRMKHRFWTEIYDGAKLFYLSGLHHNRCVRPHGIDLLHVVDTINGKSWILHGSYL